MDERQLRAYIAVVDHGRMDMAAQELGYSQPAISYQIKRLERDLGTRLFERLPSGTRLTRRGSLVLPFIQSSVTMLDGIRQACCVGLPEDSRPPVRPAQEQSPLHPTADGVLPGGAAPISPTRIDEPRRPQSPQQRPPKGTAGYEGTDSGIR